MKVLFCKIPLVSHKCLEIAPAHQKYYRFFWHKITWCYLYYIDHWIQTNPPSQFLVPEFEHPNHRIIQVANWWCIAVPSPLLGPSPLFKVPQDWSLYHPPTKSASWVPSCLHIEPFKKALGFISLKNQHKNRPLWQTRQRKALSSAGEEKKHAHISPPCLARRDSTAQPGSQSLIIGFGWLFISARSISDLSPIDLEFWDYDAINHWMKQLWVSQKFCMLCPFCHFFWYRLLDFPDLHLILKSTSNPLAKLRWT